MTTMILYSCSSEEKIGPGVNKTILETFSWHEETPETSPRFDCSGNLLNQPKITGWKVDFHEQEKEIPCTYSNTELAQMGYFYTGNKEVDPIGSTIPLDYLWWLLFVAFGLLLLIILLWLLRELSNWLFNQRITGQQVANPVIHNQEPNPRGTFVPEGYSLIPNGMVVVPRNGIYLGIRRADEVFYGEIIPMDETLEDYTPENPSPGEEGEG